MVDSDNIHSCLEILLLLVLLCAFLYWHCTSFRYWYVRGVPSTCPTPVFGNIADVFFMQCSLPQKFVKLYRKFKNKRFCGAYVMNIPVLIVSDPVLIRDILINRFDIFDDRGLSYDETDVLSIHLVTMKGSRWKWMRNFCDPYFDLNNKEKMFKIAQSCSIRLTELLEKHATTAESVDMKEMCTRFCTDIGGFYYLGLNMDSLKDYNSEVRRLSKLYFNTTISARMKQFFTYVFPKLIRFVRIAEERQTEQYFVGITKALIGHRRQNNIVRDDLLQSFINTKYNSSDKNIALNRKSNDDIRYVEKEDCLDINDGVIAAQSFMFVVGGAELTSIPMSFCLYELAVNSEIQEKLRREIDSVLEWNYKNLTYDSIVNMKYMEQVFCETLRKYPSVGNLIRVCSKPYNIPNENVILEEGTQISIPIYALHHDQKYYPDPEKFDPERFCEEKKTTRHKYTYLPFGDGPRKCIGLEFGTMQFKVGLFYLLSEYRFSLSDKRKVPLAIDPQMVFTVPKGGILLDVNPR